MSTSTTTANFREIVVARMEALGMTQVELSARAGVHRSNLSHWIKERSGLSLPSMERICGVLDLELKPARRRRSRKGASS